MKKKLALVEAHQRLGAFRNVDRVWVIDTEFQPLDGRSRPVCLCALDLAAQQRVEMFFYPGQLYENPFDCRTDLFVGYNLAAEWSVFIALDWELPFKCIDLSYEFKQQTNGKLKDDLQTLVIDPFRRKLVHACEYFGIDHLSLRAKTDEQQNIIQHGSFAAPDVPQPEYERRVIAYCWQDVRMTADLFWKLVPDMHSGQALLRGSYSRSAAWHEHNGLPLNAPLIRKILFHRSTVRARMAAQIEAEHGFGIWIVEDGEVTRSAAGLKAYVERQGWQDIWPRTSGGAYSLSKDALASLADHIEKVKVIREFGKTENLLKDFKLAITLDGWNRTPVLPFTQVTGRNTPTGANILTGPKWLRLLMQAPPGYALISADVESEEIAVASGYAGATDEIADYEAGLCAYLGLAIRCGKCPPEINTKGLVEGTPYERVRKMFKTATLATQYGGRSRTVAGKLCISTLEGDILVAQLEKARKEWWAWSDAQVSSARKNGTIETIFGWGMRVYPEDKVNGRCVGTKSTSLVNWPIQAAAAEILRLASIYLERAGYGPYLGYPHYDALYATCSIERAEEVADVIRDAFVRAGDVVIGNKIQLRVETHTYAHPEHYKEDKDAQAMYNRVLDLSWPAGPD